jgi:hypothetical protein
MRITKASVCVLLLVLAGCAAEDAEGSGGGKNGSTAGVDGAGAGAGISGGTAGISGGGQVVGGTSGGTAGAGELLPDGGMCEVGKFCGPGGPDSENCGTLELKGDVETITMPGNVLIVFDRSGSMSMDWNGMQRWQAAGDAMIGALMPQAANLTIGAVFFPSNQDFLSCVVEPIATASQLPFEPGTTAIPKLMTGGAGGVAKYSPGLGMTPTLEGLQAADAAISGATLTGTTVVILVTDGDPNCTWNEATATTLVSGWAAKGIKTHVLGVPGVGGDGELTLNAVAAAGGTGMYISPSDPTALGMKIKEIVESTVSVGIDSCEINLMPPADLPDKLALVVKNMGVEQSVPHVYPDSTMAWDITPDGSKVTLHGDFCEAAKQGVYESLRFVFGCEELPPAPPPEPE